MTTGTGKGRNAPDDHGVDAVTGPVYDRIGVGYADLRVPDPRIAAHLLAALGNARTVVNVGAGTGSYEPPSTVLAVEPSAVMVAQRPSGSARAVRAVAERLPLADGAVEATVAVLTTHHWTDPAAGLAELVRVSRRQVVLTWDHTFLTKHVWLLADYLPEIAEREAGLASLAAVTAAWPDARVLTVPVPYDCTDGFLAAWWRRPDAYLIPAVRAAMSSFALLDPDVVTRAVGRLAADLDDGTWDRRHGHLRELGELDCGYRLVVRG